MKDKNSGRAGRRELYRAIRYLKKYVMGTVYTYPSKARYCLSYAEGAILAADAKPSRLAFRKLGGR